MVGSGLWQTSEGYVLPSSINSSLDVVGREIWLLQNQSLKELGLMKHIHLFMWPYQDLDPVFLGLDR